MSENWRMRRAATVLVLVLVGLALASCGDDGDDASPVSADSSTSSPATTVATTTSAPVATVATTVPVLLECQPVPFTPNSEDVASGVTAIGLTCREAEAFVGRAGMQTSSGGPEEVDVDGYHCVRTRSEQDPLPRSFYECNDGARTVTFVRS